jgi:hypothetical protein
MMRCRYHPPNRCPPRVNGHNRANVPFRILEVLDTYELVTRDELYALVDASPEAVRRAYYRLLKSGEIMTDNAGYVYGSNT